MGLLILVAVHSPREKRVALQSLEVEYSWDSQETNLSLKLEQN
jgi:hypothetical protein